MGMFLDGGDSMKWMWLAMVLAVGTAQQEVITAQGRLRGELRDGVVTFRGIPYATLDAATGRFKQAGLAPTWPGVRQSQPTRCTASSRAVECLQLAVTVPAARGDPWPVLMWITGGAGQYHPGKLVQRGIAAVVVSHRIGVTGFLCMGEEQIPGNAGAKDAVLALRWVRDNISAFKGNPFSVVVAGQGFGAAVVEALLLSPMAQGLFHGAILQSGSILSPWAFNYDAKERGENLRNMLNEGNEETTPLMSANLDNLAHKSVKIEFPYFPFGMCVERAFKYQERLLSEPPNRLLDGKIISKVPLVIGYNSDEAYVFVSTIKQNDVVRKIFRDLSVVLPEELKFYNEVEVKEVVKQIRDFYFKNNLTTAALLAYHRDAYFVSHVYRSARFHASSHLPAYVYQFSHAAELGVRPVHGVRKAGAAHSDELAYLFPERMEDFEGDKGIVQNNLISLWTNMVKHLDPTAKGSFIQWDPFEIGNPRVLDISTELTMKRLPRQQALQAWVDIYDRFHHGRNFPAV